MTLKNSSQDTLLNWLVRSKKMAAREGRVLVRWGVWMNFSMESCRIVVGEKVRCEFVLKGVGDVARDEATNRGGDSKGAKFGGVRGILV